MSLENAKMPSLKDKIREQAQEVEEKTVTSDDADSKVEVKVKRGRKLNK